MRAKLPSLLIAAVALLASWHTPTDSKGEFTSAALMLVSVAPLFVFFGLLSVWLSDYLGSFLGPVYRGGFVDSPTPSIAFIVFGYLLLALPVLAFFYHIVAHGTRTI